MVLIDLKSGVIKNDTNSLFSKTKPARSITKRKRPVKSKTVKKMKLVKGGKNDLFKTRLSKLKVITPKEDVLLTVRRNSTNTGDTYTLSKNGKIQHEKTVNDEEANNIFSTIMKSLKDFVLRRKTGGDITGDNIAGGGKDIEYPNKLDIAENTNVYKVIYRRRGALDIFGRLLIHLILIFFFFLLYIIFVAGHVMATGSIPFSFYKKFTIVNGMEFEH